MIQLFWHGQKANFDTLDDDVNGKKKIIHYVL